MSVASLKKELTALTKEQLIEVLLGAYKANKDTKEYFEFFLNPKPDELLEKYKLQIIKEFTRTKHRRYSKARISHIKKWLKRFSVLEPGTEYVLSLYYFTVHHALLVEQALYFTAPMYNGIKKIASDALTIANNTGFFQRTFNDFDTLARSGAGARNFSSLILEALQEFINNPKNNIEHLG